MIRRVGQASLDNAVSQTNDLLDTVLQMYSEWMETGKLPGDEQNRPCDFASRAHPQLKRFHLQLKP